jgi:hypothetical protein
MMGPKTLSEIREEVRRAFGAGGGDPIQRLEQLIADAKRTGEGGEEVLESLRRFLEAGEKWKRRTRRAGTKKTRRSGTKK